MKRDVPFGNNFPIGCVVAFLDTSIVVHILEKKDAPVVDGGQIQECEKRLLLDCVNHERDEIFSLIESSPLCMDDNFMEVREDNLAS